ncbi:hypothetical protein BY458DRAFT_506118 [Sporodiniella umbellata]|nr:hypothetical protein BY458DRAFT_506118 [Sporodiniella umbellata]
MKSNSPTKFVQNHIDHFIYYDFCKQFIKDFKDQEESSSVLQKSLKAIIKGKSNAKAFKKKAEIILKDIKNVTTDERVFLLFQTKRFKAAEKKAIEENVHSLNTGARIFLEINHGNVGYAENDSSDSGEETTDKSDYEDRESTPSTDSTQEAIITKSHKTAKDYLISTNASDVIDLDSINSKWILKSGYDLSISFLKRRNELVNNCTDCSTVLEPDEELSINACSEVKESFLKYKEKDVKSHVDGIFHFTKLITEGDFDEAEDELNVSNLPSHIKAILYRFKQTYCKGYSIKSLNESTTLKDGIFPFLENYFPNNKRYTTFGADKEIRESKKRFTDIDPSLNRNVRKGDFSIVTNQSKHLIFALESKPERNKGRSNGDVIKMARYMKDTLDSIESEGFNNVVIAGMITSGVFCSCYLMEHKYDYIYTFYKQSSFYIPIDYRDMFRINAIFPIMNQLKNVLQETIVELSTLKHERNNPSSLKKLKTYHSPTQLPGSRVKRVYLNTTAAKYAKRRLQFN